jgi:Family of unknown function (DUF6941)
VSDTRLMYAIFCDDLRAEVGNKYSVMGVYTGQLFVPQVPIILPKLCLLMRARTPADQPFRQLKFLVLKGEELIAELAAPEAELAAGAASLQAPTSEPQYMELGVTLTFQNFLVEGPLLLRARAITETGELKGGSLSIAIQSPPGAPGAVVAG